MTKRIQMVVSGLLMATAVVAEPRDKSLGLHSDGAPWKMRPAKTINANLPNVLLIGDSILNGYRNSVTNGLKDKANVDAWVTPMHLNSSSLHTALKEVVTFRKYDVIHFNIGLHGWAKGRIPQGKYSELLKKYLATLKQKAPEAQLIWGSITQVHERGKQELNKEINPTIVQRSKLASVVMKGEGVTINDFYGLMSDKLNLVRGDRFHWQSQAYTIMGKQIVEVIEGKLAGSNEASSNKSDAGDGK